MEFGALGPLAVSESGREVVLGGPKQRLVLAHLLIHAGRVVSADRLIDEVWSEQPPEAARATLQSYISHLRKALGPERIQGHGQGYALRADPAEVDAQRFGALAADGRRLLPDDPQEAERTLEEALELWRGPPFADLAGEPSLQAEVTRLEEVRLAVVEDRVAARLALGRHDQLVGELEALVGTHPLRERLWEQLMVALYRCGRQSEALAAFSRARTLLAEELGIDPSPALRRIHEQVLRQDPALAPPPRLAAATNLPRSRTSFVGRRRDLDALTAMLGERRLVTLTGVGGAGKTRLATEVASRLVDRFPDGVFFVDLAPLTDGELVPSEMARAMGLTRRGGPGVTSARPIEEDLLRLLAAKRVLLLVDNCEHLLDAAAGLIDRLLERCEHVVVLATSREALQVEGEHTWQVGSLSVPDAGRPAEDTEEAEAMQLLLDRVRAVRPELDLSGDDREALARICRQLDGIPLALELAAARMAHLSPAEVDSRLADRFALLTGGRRRTERQQTLHAAVDWSYDLLDDDEQVLLRRLAVFAGGFTLPAVEGICMTGIDRPALDLLGSLVARSLVMADLQGDVTRYRLLETIRLYAEQRLVTAAEADRIRDVHRDWYLEWASRFPWDQGVLSQAVADILEVEHDNLRLALEWSRLQGRFDLVARLAVACTGLYTWNGHADEGNRWLELAATTPELPKALAAQVQICSGFLGGIRFGGDMASWIPAVEQLPAVADDLPHDHPAGALALLLVSTVHAITSLDPEAIERYADEGIARARRAGAPLLENFGLLHKSLAALHRRDYPSAVDVLERAILMPGWSVEHDPAITAVNLGIARHLAGEHEGARQAIQPILERDGSTWRYIGLLVAAIAAAGLGESQRARDELGEAVAALEGGWHTPVATHDCLLGYAALAAMSGSHEHASRLLAATQGLVSFPGLFVVYRHYRDVVRASLDADTRRRCITEGRQLGVAAALEQAVAAAAG